MRKFLAITLVGAFLILAQLVCNAGADGGLSGKYVHTSGKFSYTFSGDKVTVDADGNSVNGSYKTEGGTITFSMVETNFYVVGVLVPDGPTSYKLDGNTLIVDDEKFIKK